MTCMREAPRMETSERTLKWCQPAPAPYGATAAGRLRCISNPARMPQEQNDIVMMRSMKLEQLSQRAAG